MASIAPSANWLALKRTLNTGEEDSRPVKRRKVEKRTLSTKVSWNGNNNSAASSTPVLTQNAATTPSSPQAPKIVGDPDSKENLAAMILRRSSGKENAKTTKFLALDCEMVGVGPFGLESVLARVTVVNFVGDVVLDEFVRPQEPVTDWRTAVSGVREEDMENAKSFVEVQSLVSALLKDRYLVGHALSNDLSALLLGHPWRNIRDTQKFQPFKVLTRSLRPSLRKLVKEVFNITIQQGEHSSVIDARAPMALYRLYRKEWEGKGTEMLLETMVPPTPGEKPPSTASATEDAERSASPTSTVASSGPPKSPPRASPSPRTRKSAKNAPYWTYLTGIADANKNPGPTLPRPTTPKKKKKKQGISSAMSVVITRNENNQKTGASQSVKSPKGGEVARAAGKLAAARTSKTKEGWWKVLGK